MKNNILILNLFSVNNKVLGNFCYKVTDLNIMMKYKVNLYYHK